MFEFELLPVEEIRPWGTGDDRSLSWYALTDGYFRIHAGGQTLFDYSDEILAHWGTAGRNAQYMVAAYARDILGSVAPGVAPLPPFFAKLVSDWELVARLREASGEDDYDAWRWIGERQPWFSYLREYPEVSFVRRGENVELHWDNRPRRMEGIPVWTATLGSYSLPVDAFLGECRGFADRLLAAMQERIDGIEAGTMRPQIEVDVAALRTQHETWRTELASYFRQKDEPDIPWEVVEAELRRIAAGAGIAL